MLFFTIVEKNPRKINHPTQVYLLEVVLPHNRISLFSFRLFLIIVNFLPAE